MTTVSSQLSVESFYQYRDSNMNMLEELIDFYNTCKNAQLTQKHNNTQKNNMDSNDWKRHDPNNMLTTIKRNRDDDEILFAKMRSILNKLSDDNFLILVEEIKKLEINETQYLDKLAEFIFTKALDEPKFCIRYAKLAYEFASCKDYNTPTLSFRKLTIKRCQIKFAELPKANRENAKGCMMFIGELYNYNLIPIKIIMYCFGELMKQNGGQSFTSEYSIECIFMFMKVIGERLWILHNDESVQLFEKFSVLLKNDKLSNKEKFCVMDIIDLKKKYGSL